MIKCAKNQCSKENPGVTPMLVSFRGKAEKSCPSGLDLRFAQGDALMGFGFGIFGIRLGF
jgi:hypothetical protein